MSGINSGDGVVAAPCSWLCYLWRVGDAMSEQKYKVDGSGNKWYVWRWGVSGMFWSIVSNRYLTKRAATAAMKRESKQPK